MNDIQNHKKIAVIGAGSAGVLTICHLLYWLRPAQWSDNRPSATITSIYDPKVSSIGIGESTNPVFFNSISLAFNITDYHQFVEAGDLESTIKHGSLFKNWRDNQFLNPLFGWGSHAAIHFNTHKFKKFAFNKFNSMWKDRFNELLGSVLDIQNNRDNIIVNVNGQSHSFDYVIDCRGFPKEHNENTILNMPVNRCIVHNTPPLEKDWEYTLHQATEHGWMFGIPLKSRTSYGYLFNDNINTIDEAKIGFSKTINVPIKNLEAIEFKFKSYYNKKIFDNRLIKNGNTAVFLEPMLANSLWCYDVINKLFVSKLIYNIPDNNLNEDIKNTILKIHDSICYYYHGGSIYKTKFWENAVKYSKDVLDKSEWFKKLNEDFKYMNENDVTLDVNAMYSTPVMRNLDVLLGYNYWKKNTND